MLDTQLTHMSVSSAAVARPQPVLSMSAAWHSHSTSRLKYFDLHCMLFKNLLFKVLIKQEIE